MPLSVVVGIAPGGTTAPVEVFPLARKGQRIISSYGARTRTDMPEVLRLAARGFINPKQMVTQRFPLKEADSAYKALDRGEIVGRAVVIPWVLLEYQECRNLFVKGGWHGHSR